MSNNVVNLGNRVSSGQIIGELIERKPTVLAAVEKSADGRWRFSFSGMKADEMVACLGMLKVLESALMGALKPTAKGDWP